MGLRSLLMHSRGALLGQEQKGRCVMLMRTKEENSVCVQENRQIHHHHPELRGASALKYGKEKAAPACKA